MKQPLPQAGQQSGVMLIEAMLAILIFSIGVLGIIGLQAAANKASVQAKYRSEASLLANEIIGRMWASDRKLATIAGNFADAIHCPQAQAAAAALNPPVNVVCTASEYRKWAWEGVSANPGTATAPANGTVLQLLPSAVNFWPDVEVRAVPSPLPLTYPAADRIPRSEVTVRVRWLPPGEPPPSPQRPSYVYETTVQIGG
jgi:type IV pilus assembly protein PilV